MKNQEPAVNENYRCVMRDGIVREEVCPLLTEHHMEVQVKDGNILSVTCTPEYLEELVLGLTLTAGSSLERLSVISLADEQIFQMAEVMAKGMPLHEATWGTHSCFLFREGKLLFSCEDIGRHNALDKVIGYAIKQKIELKECAVYTSGRVPSDMAEKAICAGIPVLVSKGVPTKDAVELAKEYGLTLVCGARKDQMRIYADFRRK